MGGHLELFLKGWLDCVELNAVSVNSQRHEGKGGDGPFTIALQHACRGQGWGKCPGDSQEFLSSRGAGQGLFGFTPSLGQDVSSSGPPFLIIRAFTGAPTFAFSEMETPGRGVRRLGGREEGEGATPCKGSRGAEP